MKRYLPAKNGNIVRGKTFIPSTRINCSFRRMDYYYRKNGTGKTTLLESMMQLIKYEGVMSYKNTTLKKIKDAAQHMYLVYQNPELQFITNSVYEEIYIHYNHQEPSIAEKETMKLLKLLHLEAVKNQHPFELSMGQKRRLSVATALSSRAEIILLDEPTFGLDSHNTFQLIELFQESF